MDPALFERVVAFEEGRLTEDETIALFQELINAGDAWKLPGRFGRVAWDLIQAGICELPRKIDSFGRPLPSRCETKPVFMNESSNSESTDGKATS